MPIDIGAGIARNRRKPLYARSAIKTGKNAKRGRRRSIFVHVATNIVYPIVLRKTAEAE